MKTKSLLGVLLLISTWAFSQKPPEPTPPPDAQPRMRHRHEMGKWWKDSEVAKQLQLSDGQMSQLDQIFFDHRLKLIDYGAEMEKQDLKLQNLLEADVPNEGQINSQVDQVLAARGKLERETTMMNLDLRKVLSVEQWKQLKSIREERGGRRDTFFYKRLPGPPPPPGAPAPPPGPPGDEMMQ